MSADTIGYFGYGSLVNADTLRTEYIEHITAELSGYCRHWQARSKTLAQPVALLSVHADPKCSIKGMLVVDHRENLAAVDERESGYQRHCLSADQLQLSAGAELPAETYVYIANEPSGVVDNGALMQSYIDAVMQGFIHQYGADGARHFVETTIGFDRPLLRDREQPQYPRAVQLSESERETIDALLSPLVAW